MKLEQYEAAAEAILFAMGESVELSKIASALEVTERDAVSYTHLTLPTILLV